MSYTPIDLSANLNCRAIALKYKRNDKLWPENMNLTTKILAKKLICSSNKLLTDQDLKY